MKDIVNAMIHKYGLEDVLTEIGRGISSVADEINVETEHNKLLRKCCNEASTKVFEARNLVRKLSQ